MNNPLISIIIPSYNVENYITKGIESCLNQSYKNIEVIIVDDGSNDNTTKVVERYLDDKRLTLIKKANSGVSATRNIGIKNTNGQYCVFLDSDDWLELNTIERLVSLIDGSKLIACSYNNFVNGKLCKVKEYPSKLFGKNKALEYASKREYNLDSACFKLFDLNIIKNNNIYFDESITNIEDGLFVFEYLHHIKRVEYLNEALWIVNKREGSVTSSAFNENRLTCLKAIKKMLNEYDNSFEVYQNLLLYLACTLRYLIISMFYSNTKGKYKILITEYKKELILTYKNKCFPRSSVYNVCTFIFFGYVPYFLLNPFMQIYKRILGRV